MSNERNRSDATSTAAIFARLWDSESGGLTPQIARQVLKLRFSDQDVKRMHELAEKNQSGALSGNEGDELDNFIRVGDLLAILQSKARKLLKRKPKTLNQHG